MNRVLAVGTATESVTVQADRRGVTDPEFHARRDGLRAHNQRPTHGQTVNSPKFSAWRLEPPAPQKTPPAFGKGTQDIP